MGQDAHGRWSLERRAVRVERWRAPVLCRVNRSGCVALRGMLPLEQVDALLDGVVVGEVAEAAV